MWIIALWSKAHYMHSMTFFCESLFVHLLVIRTNLPDNNQELVIFVSLLAWPLIGVRLLSLRW